MKTASGTGYLCSSILPQDLRYVGRDSSCMLEIEIIEDKILVLSFIGVMDAEDQTASETLIRSVFTKYVQAGLPTGFFVIADVSRLNWVNVAARKSSQMSVADMFSIGHVKYLLIVSPNYIIRNLFNLLRRFDRQVSFTTCKTKEEAFTGINRYRIQNQLAKIPKTRVSADKIHLPGKIYPEMSQPNTKTPPQNFWQKLSRRLGFNAARKQYTQSLQIKFLKEEIESIRQNQKKRIDQLFRMMSSITWDESFTPGNFEGNIENDPFSLLIDAAEMLQRDVKEMIEQSREMHGILEAQISERTREIAMKESNLSALIENTPDLILLADSNYNVLIANSSVQKITENVLGSALVPGMNLTEVIKPEIFGYWKSLVDNVLAGASHKAIGKLPIRGKDHYFEYSINPVVDIEGDISRFSFFAKDITSKQLAEQEVRKQQQLLSSINKSIKEGIFRSTPHNGILYVNEAFAEMFGYDSVEEVLPLDPDALYVNTARRQDFRQLMQENTYFTNEEAEFKRKDGTIFWGLMSSIKTEGENGEIYFDGAIRDVTKMREDERQIKEQNQKLIKVNHELDKFVYSVSHDLRAPLVSVKGLINIARIEPKEDLRNQYYDLMDNSINKLDAFIKEIMGYSRNSRTQLMSQKIDFQSVISDVFEVLRFAPDNDKIDKKVTIDISGDFHSDLMRMKMVFNNIISNSFRYSDLSKKHPYVSIQVTGNADLAEIKICDNGIGIAPESINKIFDMFYRGTKNSQGSGIGLYIVSEALDKLGGTISVDSELGIGTCFTIKIPAITN
ncbi:MAG: PAS domain-containing sensor histidine kinase [Bacteroidia bacterium]